MKQMRFLSYLLIAVLSIGLTGCSDDEKEDISIIGTWEITNSKGWSYQIRNGEEYKDNWDENESGFFITFDEDNTGYSYEDVNYKKTFNWSMNGDKVKLIRTDIEKAEEGTVKELTANKLVVLFVIEENGRIVEEDTTTYRRIK